MWRVVVLCWIFIAPALAGVLVVITLLTAALAPEVGRWIVYAAIAGAILGLPAAVIIAETQSRGLV